MQSTRIDELEKFSIPQNCQNSCLMAVIRVFCLAKHLQRHPCIVLLAGINIYITVTLDNRNKILFFLHLFVLFGCILAIKFNDFEK